MAPEAGLALHAVARPAAPELALIPCAGAAAERGGAQSSAGQEAAERTETEEKREAEEAEADDEFFDAEEGRASSSGAGSVRPGAAQSDAGVAAGPVDGVTEGLALASGFFAPRAASAAGPPPVHLSATAAPALMGASQHAAPLTPPPSYAAPLAASSAAPPPLQHASPMPPADSGLARGFYLHGSLPSSPVAPAHPAATKTTAATALPPTQPLWQAFRGIPARTSSAAADPEFFGVADAFYRPASTSRAAPLAGAGPAFPSSLPSSPAAKNAQAIKRSKSKVGMVGRAGCTVPLPCTVSVALERGSAQPDLSP
jgi:hypothetical protein